MRYSDSITWLDIEISSICNAGCAVCPRTDKGIYTPFTHTYWSISDIKKTINASIIKNLKGLSLCGNFGDPMGNPQILDIVKYFKETNPNINIHINTNGGIGNSDTYSELGKLGTHITFGIDGVGEKNELYRVNVKWDKLMENLKAFSKTTKPELLQIQFILWRETTDQIIPIIDEIQKLGMGSLWLRKPFTENDLGTEIFDMRGNFTHVLNEIDDSRLFKYLNTTWDYDKLNTLKDEIIELNLKIPVISRERIFPNVRSDVIKKEYQYTKIDNLEIVDVDYQTCYSKNNDNPHNLSEDSFNLYITHDKKLMPCCIIPPNISTHIKFSAGDESSTQRQILNKLLEIGIDKFSLADRTLKDVFDSGVIHQFVYKDILKQNSFNLCKTVCGKKSCQNNK